MINNRSLVIVTDCFCNYLNYFFILAHLFWVSILFVIQKDYDHKSNEFSGLWYRKLVICFILIILFRITNIKNISILYNKLVHEILFRLNISSPFEIWLISKVCKFEYYLHVTFNPINNGCQSVVSTLSNQFDSETVFRET